MRFLIMGPPGAGKGTQASGISEAYGIPTVATGEMFRSHIAQGTPLGKEVDAIISAGQYVPDDITEAIVYERLAAPECADGFLLDGFPRTLHQVQSLDAFLDGRGERIDAVLRLVADADVIVGRLLKRATIEGRSDDNEATIRHRQELYLSQTAPLIEEYRRRGILVEVDALGEVSEVGRRIREGLDQALTD